MPRLDEIRSQTYRLLIGDECFTRMSGSLQRQSEMESRRREIGVKLDGAAKGRQRLLEIAQFSQRYADAVVDDRVSRIESRSLSKLRECAIELRPIEKRESTLLVRALLLDWRSRLLGDADGAKRRRTESRSRASVAPSRRLPRASSSTSATSARPASKVGSAAACPRNLPPAVGNPCGAPMNEPGARARLPALSFHAHRGLGRCRLQAAETGSLPRRWQPGSAAVRVP